MEKTAQRTAGKVSGKGETTGRGLWPPPGDGAARTWGWAGGGVPSSCGPALVQGQAGSPQGGEWMGDSGCQDRGTEEKMGATEGPRGAPGRPRPGTLPGTLHPTSYEPPLGLEPSYLRILTKHRREVLSPPTRHREISPAWGHRASPVCTPGGGLAVCQQQDPRPAPDKQVVKGTPRRSGRPKRAPAQPKARVRTSSARLSPPLGWTQPLWRALPGSQNTRTRREHALVLRAPAACGSAL